MIADLLDIDALPQQSASQVKNKWAELVRRVREVGSVAITNHSKVEMVVVEAGRYQEMTTQIETMQRRQQAVLDELSKRFDERLDKLQSPGFREKLDAVFEARGELRNRPKAGETF
jgi:prevent-host-death family protein